MKQQRNTRQRELILNAVRSRHDHPSADDIYLDVLKIDSKISRATVYRNLNLLSEAGEILQVKVHTADRFDCRLDYHYHIICTECGRIANLDIPYNDNLDTDIQHQTDYQVSRHRTVFEGICPHCQSKYDTSL